MLVWPLWRNGSPIAHGGIALATALAGVLNALLLWRALRRREIYRPGAGWGRYLAQLTFATTGMALAVWGLQAWLGDWTSMPIWQRIAALAVCLAVGGASYAVLLLGSGLRTRHLREP
jgi:putative peptidoglycan lipid II flippase